VPQDIPGLFGGATHPKNYRAELGAAVDLLDHPVVSATSGREAMVVSAAEGAYRVMENPPVLGPFIRPVSAMRPTGERASNSGP